MQKGNIESFQINYPCIVDSWVTYRREVFGESLEETATYIAKMTGKKADKSNLYMYRSRYRSAPDHILYLIEMEYFELLTWLFKRHNIDTSKISELARDLGLPIKRLNEIDP